MTLRSRRRSDDRGVVAEVEAVQPEHRLEQEIELERLDASSRLSCLRRPSALYRYSHTRSSESSCSVSTGLVM